MLSCVKNPSQEAAGSSSSLCHEATNLFFPTNLAAQEHHPQYFGALEQACKPRPNICQMQHGRRNGEK